MNKAKWKDIGIRAGKTFLQAFLSAVVIDASTLTGGVNVWKSLLISGVAAGISAMMNAAIAALSNDYL